MRACPGPVAVYDVPGGPEADAAEPGPVEVEVPPGVPCAAACSPQNTFWLFAIAA